MKLMIGTAQFGRNYGIANDRGMLPTDEVLQILNAAKNNGISFIDTSSDYGISENLIGDISTKLNYDFNVVTKIYLKDSNINIKDKINESIKKLKTNCIFGLLIHNPNDLLSPGGDELLNTFLEFKKHNLVKNIGVSAGTIEQILKIIDMYPIDIVQVPLNIFNQGFAGVIPRLKEKNIKIHSRSTFMQGLILMNVNNLHTYFAGIKHNINQINNIAREYNVSITKFALEYVKSLDVDNIIVGVDNPEQFNTLIAEYNKPFAHYIDFKQFAIEDEKFIDPGRWPIGGWR